MHSDAHLYSSSIAIMASCSDLTKIEYGPIPKALPVPVSTSKKFAEPFNRLKNRANLFRRKNYSSQLNISSSPSDHRPLSCTDHIIPSDQLSITSIHNTGDAVLKRSNSMICPQQHLQVFLNQNNNNNNNNNYYINHRNSICLELAGCSTDESSTDDYQLTKSSSNRYWTKSISSTMNDIDENEILSTFPIQPSLPPTIIEESNINLINENEPEEKVLSSLPNNNNNSEHTSAILPLSQSTMDVIIREKEDKEKQQEQITSTSIPTSIISSSHSSSSSSTVILRDHAEAIRTRRQCHSSISLLQHQQRQQQSLSSFEESFYDCKQQTSPKKTNHELEMSLTKISACTMTGKSLNNLDESLSATSSEEKGVQTTLNEPINTNACVKRAISSTSLSSSSTSIKTDSLEKKPKMPTSSTIDETTSTNDIDAPTNLTGQYQNESLYKWPHVNERLLGEQPCIYWVNYLGSTAIKMLNDGTTAMPSQAISRLKQSTQYARVLPIIGLSISSRGVEFLKHAKERVVICFHDIKSIHCACQDEDLRYFAYVTREQRLTNGMSHTNSNAATATSIGDNKQQTTPPSPSLSSSGEFHHYCHVFVVKSEAMSTEIMLTFGQVFDIAYRIHRRFKLNGKKSKETHTPSPSITNCERHRQLEVIRLTAKFDSKHNNSVIMSSSTHSPTTSSSSSSTDDRKIYV
ncbi:unnamed protein product [Rotaria socialis]|uniref:PID domain-containing protein n=2 Tax=Rotaria socialis TaxID=392032 RepID=A0A820VSA3_9BILA|nr:unnamed protein product [Rotaria socialis]CAF4506144.1 unnamed protein product [Rotaria socialis]